MSTLFFIMLTLFVVSILLVHKRTQNLADINKVLQEQNERMKEYEKLYVATQKQLDKINELNRSIEKIDNNYFAYDAEYKRHTLKNIQVAFNTNSSDIYDLNIEDRDKLLNEMLKEDGIIEKIVNVGASFKGCKDSIELANKYENVYVFS